jgi:hypothetical protein
LAEGVLGVREEEEDIVDGEENEWVPSRSSMSMVRGLREGRLPRALFGVEEGGERRLGEKEEEEVLAGELERIRRLVFDFVCRSLDLGRTSSSSSSSSGRAPNI